MYYSPLPNGATVDGIFGRGVDMPDITMCDGKGCPLKQNCYRFTAKPNERQSYFAEAPWERDGRSKYCAHFVTDERSKKEVTENIKAER